MNMTCFQDGICIFTNFRSGAVGKPNLYSVSDYFLNYFGLNNVTDMPKLKEVETVVENAIGEATV